MEAAPTTAAAEALRNPRLAGFAGADTSSQVKGARGALAILSQRRHMMASLFVSAYRRFVLG